MENQYSAIIIDETGKEVENIANIILEINAFEELYDFRAESITKIDIDKNLIEKLRNKAKKLVKWKTSRWKTEIKALNDKIFNIEQKKKEKIYNHRSRTLKIKLESTKKTLEKRESKRPTEKQKLNIKMLTDEKRKKEREDQVNLLEEQIKFTKLDIARLEKELDDLSFEYDDLKTDMKKRNLSKFYTNLNAFAIIRF